MQPQVRTPLAYEWPTVCLLIVTYALWLFITHFAVNIGLVFSFLILTPVITLHSSLQHEVLHTMEPRWKWASQLAVFPAIGLLVPYLRFRDTHLAHHNNEILTDPYDDPESFYLVKEVWVTLPRWQQLALQFNNTLFGRILIGPLIGQISFMRNDWGLIKGGDQGVLFAWIIHFASVALVIFVLGKWGTMPFWVYFCACYFGLSLLKIRTFLEHRANEQANGRSVIIEDRGLFSLLFLNNNFHATHHAYPQVPWYRLPQLFRNNKDRFLAQNRGYYYANYWQIFKAYFFKTKEPVKHPLWSLENRNDR